MLFEIMVKEQEEKQEQVENESPTQLVGKKEITPIAKHPVQHGINGGINAINFFDEKQLVAAENFLTKVMRSDKGGIKSVNDGLAVLMRAQDLQLPFSTCIEHIHVINGKTGVDIHIVKALLSRAGCTWRCLKDYQPLYEYTDGINVYIDGSFPEYVVRCVSQKEAEEKAKIDISNNNTDNIYVYPVKWYQDFNGNMYKDYQLNTKSFGIGINRQQIAEIAKSGKTPVYRIPNKPVDFVTEYEITRIINGKEITSKGHFSYSEAIQAEMLEKDTYKKYPRILIGHRAFTLAARDIASDILFGVMETTELKIVAGRELSDNDIASVEDAEVIEL